MINPSKLFKNYYLKEAKKLNWQTVPKIAFRKEKNNHYNWFHDGKINLYENCVTKNLKKKKKKKKIKKNKKKKKKNKNN